MEWIEIASHDQMDEEALADQKRWLHVAEDLALIPEEVVRVEEQDDGKVRILIHAVLHEYFQQGVI